MATKSHYHFVIVLGLVLSKHLQYFHARLFINEAIHIKQEHFVRRFLFNLSFTNVIFVIMNLASNLYA